MFSQSTATGIHNSSHSALNQDYSHGIQLQNAKGVSYILHSTNTITKTGKNKTLHSFSKEEKAGALDAVPTGYVGAETANGLPVLKEAV
jgi:hypothetical protein